MDRSGKRALVSFAAGVVVGVVGLATYAATTGGALTQPARVRVLEGFTVAVNASGTAIGFGRSADDQTGEGYSLSGAMWRSADGNWHEAFEASDGESCVPPSSSGQKLRLGVVDVPPIEDAPGGPRVVWFECLGEPSDTEA